jgi:hypothetical protein
VAGFASGLALDVLAQHALGRDALIDSLRRTVAGLDWHPEGTEWADYDRPGMEGFFAKFARAMPIVEVPDSPCAIEMAVAESV